jgi:hypothetical protein
MSSSIEDFLDEVDRWKFKVHERLKRLTAKQRRAFWEQSAERARAMGFNVVEPQKTAKRPAKRARRTG